MKHFPPHLSAATRRLYWALQVVAHLLVPVVFLGLLWRARREPGHLSGLHERLGLGPTGKTGAVWLFTASVGEIRAASPLVRRLRAAGRPVLLTYQSPAGKAEGQRLFPDDPGITHRFVPLDLFWAVRLFLRRARPTALIVLEIEIWPSMLIESYRHGLPLIMANGNLLSRSINKAGILRRHLLTLYQLFSAIFTRGEDYRQRYISIGVDDHRIRIVGEMKYDQLNEPAHLALGAALRDKWRGLNKVLLIASSVQDEEPLLLPMVTRLLAENPGFGVIWAPRSPQRFGPVAAALTKAGFSPIRRSSVPDLATANIQTTRVIVGDSVGEMDIWYQMADLVFVGASLVPMGGHNIMEPLSLGKPVVMGPSTYGIAFAAEPAGNMGAFTSMADAASLEKAISSLLKSDKDLAEMAAAAETFAKDQKGAADRTAQGVLALLSSGKER
jgi:3-deoxy-D-manno-octulosonic-acid transferase